MCRVSDTMGKRTYDSRKTYPDAVGEKISNTCGCYWHLTVWEPVILQKRSVQLPCLHPAADCYGKEKYPVYLLSDHVGIMTCLNLE